MDEIQISDSRSRPRLPRKWLWRPNLIVFISSACIMILELVAERIIAPYVGSSLYTWTSIIGVILAGISLGNFLGGWMADRGASTHMLGRIFLLGGLASIGVLLVDTLHLQVIDNWPLIIQSLLLIAALFFPPAFILGTVSPVVAKLSMTDLNKTGRIVGRIYASGSVGSIAGTFLTGFFLTFFFSTHTIVWSVGGILLLLGLLFLVTPATDMEAP
ncbi:MAG: fused MFS/spermidine synthase [Anaerolineae bacterium]|nr:fused MFS/spermidine synthase [Anaerolineae bacterium]